MQRRGYVYRTYQMDSRRVWVSNVHETEMKSSMEYVLIRLGANGLAPSSKAAQRKKEKEEEMARNKLQGGSTEKDRNQRSIWKGQRYGGSE